MSRVRTVLRYWVPVMAWAMFIFAGSTGLGASRHSSRIIGPLVRWFYPAISETALHQVVLCVRKTAHVTEYAVLALLLWRALRQPGKQDPRPWSWTQAGLALAGASAYAATDELHQALVPSRQGQWSDVLLDTCGAALGLLLLWCVLRWRQRT